MIGLARSSLQYRAIQRDDDALRLALIRLAKQYGRYGYRKIAKLFRVEGWKVNHKKVERLWHEEVQQLPQRHKKRKRLSHKDSSIICLRPTHPNHVSAIDFVHDKLSNDWNNKMLTVLNEFTRQALAVTVRIKMGVEDVLEALYPLLLRHGAPEYIQSDNGPEFAAEATYGWLRHVGSKPIRIYPGTSWENVDNERFTVQRRTASGGPQCRVVHDYEAGTDRHQSLAQAIQSHPPSSSAKHASASPRNLTRETADQWPRHRGLDAYACVANLFSSPFTCFRSTMILFQAIFSLNQVPDLSCIIVFRHLQTGAIGQQKFNLLLIFQRTVQNILGSG